MKCKKSQKISLEKSLGLLDFQEYNIIKIIKMVSESRLELALKNSWTKESSSDSEGWSFENPAWGQCAVTALIINDYLGGEIVWANAILPYGREISHYFNKICGFEKDFTIMQFPKETKIPNGIPKKKQYLTTRAYILSCRETQKRYEFLKARVEKFLRSFEQTKFSY